MKKIVKISALALFAIAGFVSCNEEEFVYVPEEPQLDIIESDILFDANGGTGTVTFDAKGSVTMTCNSDWCTASVSGNTLTVTADTNYGLDGRAATIILTCNGQDTKVTAQQTGMVFSYVDQTYVIEMAGEEFVLNGKSSFPTTYESDEWIKVDELLGNYIISVKRNDSGDKRTGTIKITSGDVTAVITIIQKFERDFTGTYEMQRFTSAAETTLEKTEVTITRDSEDPDLYLVSGWNDIVFPLHFDVERNQLYLLNAEYLGQHTDGNYKYNIKQFVNSSGSGYVAYNQTDNYKTWFDFKLVDGKYSITFNDAPPSASYAASTGFAIYTFTVAPGSGTALASANRVTSLFTVRKPNFYQK